MPGDSNGHVLFGQDLYDLPKNSHIPSHYDLLPARESPPLDPKELESEWFLRDSVEISSHCTPTTYFHLFSCRFYFDTIIVDVYPEVFLNESGLWRLVLRYSCCFLQQFINCDKVFVGHSTCLGSKVYVCSDSSSSYDVLSHPWFTQNCFYLVQMLNQRRAEMPLSLTFCLQQLGLPLVFTRQIVQMDTHRWIVVVLNMQRPFRSPAQCLHRVA